MYLHKKECLELNENASDDIGSKNTAFRGPKNIKVKDNNTRGAKDLSGTNCRLTRIAKPISAAFEMQKLHH